MTVALRVRRPIPDTRWRRRVGRENRPEGGREGGREVGERGERGVVGNTRTRTASVAITTDGICTRTTTHP